MTTPVGQNCQDMAPTDVTVWESLPIDTPIVGIIKAGY
jgi:hypothetical protein